MKVRGRMVYKCSLGEGNEEEEKKRTKRAKGTQHANERLGVSLTFENN